MLARTLAVASLNGAGATTLHAPNGDYAVLLTPGPGSAQPDVTLEGLTITGSTTGEQGVIQGAWGGALTLIGCIVSGKRQRG